MQNPNTETSPFSVPHCLLTLKKLIGSSSVANSSSPLPSSPLGDCIGTESCIDLKGNDSVSEEYDMSGNGSGGLCRERRRAEGKKEFPPPIPSLARTENLSSHMPWVLKRYYTSDGRLILKEERVKHHEYFLAQRCNGRLTLQLIPLDDEIDQCYPPFDQEDESENEEKEDEEGDEKEEEEEEAIDYSCDEDDESKEVKSNSNEEKESDEINDYNAVKCEDQRKNNDSNGGLGGNLSPPFKCLNYNTVIQASNCIFQMPVPALRPVHT